MGSKTTWTTVIVVVVVLALIFWAYNRGPADDGSDVIDTTPVVDNTNVPPTANEQTQPEQPVQEIPATVGATVSLKSAFIAEPNEITVKAGEAVEFLNEGDVYHVINIDKIGGNIVFESPELKKDGKTSYVFEEAGTYNFYSATFAPLRGKITVE